MQFKDISNRCRWGYQAKLGKLKELLKDEALVYCSYLPTEVKESYRQLCDKMNMRFGQKDTPRTSQTNLFILKQKDDESLEVWSARCMSTFMDAWQDESEVVDQTQAINTFLHGAKDVKASLSVMDRELATMDEAIQQMRQAVSNQQAVSKSRKSAGNIRSIYMEEDDEAQIVTFPDNSEGDTVHQIHKPFNSNQKVSFQDTQIKDIETSSMKDSTEKHFTEILDALKSRSHEPSPHYSDRF